LEEHVETVKRLALNARKKVRRADGGLLLEGRTSGARLR
tara:strand:- start:48 stop:164 length:117 start_codon:yes stop_codon:yes gene_type:complete